MSDASSDHNSSNIKAEFIAKIRDPDFPCVGAKAAEAKGNLTLELAGELDGCKFDAEIHDRLLGWVKKQAAMTDLRSFAVIFDGPDDLDEAEFEDAMWQRLQALVDRDADAGQPRVASVSADPADTDFALSLGGKAFFVVGMHPQASRPARRFARPVLVFNLHEQFDLLRQEGKFERMRDVILTRDVALAGYPNPMLSDHGKASAARQYSGRLVGADWVCPFADPRT